MYVVSGLFVKENARKNRYYSVFLEPAASVGYKPEFSSSQGVMLELAAFLSPESSQ